MDIFFSGSLFKDAKHNPSSKSKIPNAGLTQHSGKGGLKSTKMKGGSPKAAKGSVKKGAKNGSRSGSLKGGALKTGKPW